MVPGMYDTSTLECTSTASLSFARMARIWLKGKAGTLAVKLNSGRLVGEAYERPMSQRMVNGMADCTEYVVKGLP
jgi:hypothetical protein